MKKRIYILIFLLIAVRLFGVSSPIAFRHLTTADGLSDNSVNAVYQDHLGFMWFGTQAGLNLYDGYSVTDYHYSALDTTGISDDNINAIIEDAEGNLWIGTNLGGLNRFLRDRKVFRHYQYQADDSTSLPDNFVKCLSLDSHGELWIGTGSGLSLYQKETDSFINYLPNLYIKTIHEDSDGKLWVGTASNGLFRRDRSGNHFVQYAHDPLNPFSINTNSIEAIAEDTLKNIWIGTLDGGLSRFDQTTGRFIHYREIFKDKVFKTNNTIFSLFRDRSGTLWAGTENGGLIRIFIRSNGHLAEPFVSFGISVHDNNNPGSLSNNTVLSIYEDREGNLWVGTFSGGINLVSKYQKPFRNHRVEPFREERLSHNMVQCFWEDSLGNLWIGTDGGGLDYFDRRKNIFRHHTYATDDPQSISNDHILDICEDHAGNLWLATWNGLNTYDFSNSQFSHYNHDDQNPNSLISNKVTCVLEYPFKKIWVGTITGLNVFDPVTQRFFNAFEDSLGNVLRGQYIQSLYSDRAGNLWIGTVWGLFLLTHENLISQKYHFMPYLHQQDSTSLSDNHVFSTVEDRQGRLWIATLNGLNCFDFETQRFSRFTMQDGLPSNRIVSVIEDDQGFIWAGTHQGISKLDPSTRQITSFDVRDGLVGDDFTQGVIKTRRGELVFGSKSGFTIFYPDSITTCPYIPPIVLTDFQIFNRSMPFFSVRNEKIHAAYPDSLAIELSHDQDIFSFEFAALDYTAPEKNQYQYKLEGFDTEWRQTNAMRRFATYTNLPPGDYVFRAQGTNSDGIWNEKGLSIALKINPPFWQTRWAILFYVAVIIAVLLLLRQLIVYREKMKTEILLERKEAERIHEIDTLKLRFFTNVSHEFRTPITLIIGLLERLMRAKGPFQRKELFKNYRIMLRSARRLLRLINQIMDIRKLDAGVMRLELKNRDIIHFIKAIFSAFAFQAEQRQIRYEFTTHPEQISIWFDPDKIEKIVYNLLSNAFKFTRDGGSITVEVGVTSQAKIGVPDQSDKKIKDEQGNYLDIKIRDDGIGIPDEYLEKIFDPFVQVEGDGEISSVGSGVGLALTRELVAFHQGKIDVTSAVGKGSCFAVKLPLNLKPEKAVQIHEEDSTDEPIKLSFTSDDMEFHPTVTEDTDKSTPLILIADDEIDFVSYLKEELSPEYRVISAPDGEAAYKLAVENNPDLIISDVRMPQMDGFTLCSTLKQNKKTSYIPFILLTSKTGEKSRINGFDVGADDYVEKPFDSHLFKRRITNLLASRKELRERFSHEIYLQPRNIVITPEDERFLQHVIECVDDHIEDSTFSVSHLGNEIGLSRVQLYRKIKALTQLTPNDLIKTLRLKRSAQLLEKSHLTISEIAYRVGFKDPSYFCKCFRSLYGVSPMEYTRDAGNKQKKQPVLDIPSEEI